MDKLNEIGQILPTNCHPEINPLNKCQVSGKKITDTKGACSRP